MWEILDAASRRADNYDEEENQRRFQRYMDKALDWEDPIRIGTVFHMAAEHVRQGWSPPIDLNVSFTNIPHRRWLYGTYLIRGEITVLGRAGRRWEDGAGHGDRRRDRSRYPPSSARRFGEVMIRKCFTSTVRTAAPKIRAAFGRFAGNTIY